jgi:hypothetical protein
MWPLSSPLMPPCWAGRSHSTHCTLYMNARVNDDLFDRLETVRIFLFFTGEGDMENMGRGNTEPRGLKARVL